MTASDAALGAQFPIESGGPSPARKWAMRLWAVRLCMCAGMLCVGETAARALDVKAHGLPGASGVVSGDMSPFFTHEDTLQAGADRESIVVEAARVCGAERPAARRPFVTALPLASAHHTSYTTVDLGHTCVVAMYVDAIGATVMALSDTTAGAASVVSCPPESPYTSLAKSYLIQLPSRARRCSPESAVLLLWIAMAGSGSPHELLTFLIDSQRPIVKRLGDRRVFAQRLEIDTAGAAPRVRLLTRGGAVGGDITFDGGIGGAWTARELALDSTLSLSAAWPISQRDEALALALIRARGGEWPGRATIVVYDQTNGALRRLSGAVRILAAGPPGNGKRADYLLQTRDRVLRVSVRRTTREGGRAYIVQMDMDNGHVR